MLKNVLPVKNTVLFIKRIQEFISSYHSVMRQLNYHLKQDGFQNCHPNYYLPKCAKYNAFIVACYRFVCMNKGVTYITNEVSTSRHNCVFDLFDIDLQLPKRLAKCKLFHNIAQSTLYATINLVPPSNVLNKLIVCLNCLIALANYVGKTDLHVQNYYVL